MQDVAQAFLNVLKSFLKEKKITKIIWGYLASFLYLTHFTTSDQNQAKNLFGFSEEWRTIPSICFQEFITFKYVTKREEICGEGTDS